MYFLIVGATTLAAWLLVGKTLSPLDRLAAQAQDVSAEGLAVRLNAPSSDAEMLHLTRTLNDLLGRLERESRIAGAGAFMRRLRTNCARRFKRCWAKPKSRCRARVRNRFIAKHWDKFTRNPNA